MSALPFSLAPERLARQLEQFHARGEIAWLGLSGRFEAPGTAVVRYERLEPGYLGGGGTAALNGGFIATGFDAACVLVALGHVDVDVVATMTLQIQYLRLATTGQGLVFRAEALKVARRAVFVQAALCGERDDTPMAVAHATLAPLQRPQALKPPRSSAGSPAARP